jgi:hypothetical protein
MVFGRCVVARVELIEVTPGLRPTLVVTLSVGNCAGLLSKVVHARERWDARRS